MGSASAKENVRLVVCDSHRPIHHSYNDESDQNHVLFHNPDGGDVPMEAIPLADSAAGEAGVPTFHMQQLMLCACTTSTSSTRPLTGCLSQTRVVLECS